MRRSFVFAVFLSLWRLTAAEGEPANAAHPLVWDAMEKSLDVKPEDGTAVFQFTATNSSDLPVEIVAVSPSCGCTVAETPPRPWIIKPGEKSSFKATVDFRGKHGKFSKSIFVHTPLGSQALHVTVDIPETAESARERNRQLAFVDRQAVFRGDCASCHVTRAAGKTGAALFEAACGICHLAAPRAAMVPDLAIAREPRDAAYWRRWIEEGKEDTLMPAFAKRHQGPLSEEQISSLVEYLLATLPTKPGSN
jgi:mono/diheme cytochrome c family protein